MLVCCDNVHVTFNDYGSSLSPDPAGRAVKRIQQAALVKHWRLRRVDVLSSSSVTLVECTGAESSSTSLIIADGKHKASSEPVVKARVTLHRKAGAQQLLIFKPDATKMITQSVPRARAES